ncbi:beta-lactamase class A [Nostoc sp. PCC 7524]|uniref:serine hydrolase n=1 Tax=Nostoc sp. (strain ATCC 29411 / PCC 7524) TaxID=28072 RepID=UPI00029F1366|nr:serine hydrolase [Nostoc sp. PCC 7524]AFY49283.1 beta-lactamase class A [Nostoc sp. PCC 7524]
MKSPVLFLGLLSSILVSFPANAARLQSWNFNPTKNQLSITTDSGVKPKAFLINNPTRLVIDLPQTKLNSSTARQNFGSGIQEIRVGKFDGQTTRIVVELAPGYTADPEKLVIKGDSASHWIVDLSAIERGIYQASSSEDKVFIPIQPVNFAGVVPLNREISQLDSQIKSLMARYRSLSPGMFFLDMETGEYLDINGEKIFPAASTIKFPILVALFQEIEAGRVRTNETLVMRRDLMTGGSGNMQYQKPGTKFNLLETANRMMIISDNTATNMIIDRLGGKNRLNERFRSWGLQNTVIRNLLGDFKGTNTTSAKDLVRLAALISNEKLLGSSGYTQVMNIMSRCKNRSLLPVGLGKGAAIAHKTGTLGRVLGDAGIIQTPSGKRYLAGILVARPFRDARARSFINQVSRLVYGYIEQPRAVSQK